jgi:hypothetical protein
MTPEHFPDRIRMLPRYSGRFEEDTAEIEFWFK